MGREMTGTRQWKQLTCCWSMVLWGVHSALGLPHLEGRGWAFFKLANLFIFGHTGSWLLREGFLSLWCTGFLLWYLLLWSTASSAKAQQLWHKSLVAPW